MIEDFGLHIQKKVSHVMRFSTMRYEKDERCERYKSYARVSKGEEKSSD